MDSINYYEYTEWSLQVLTMIAQESDGMILPPQYISTAETTFQYQDDLPSLPVPSLKHTLEAYLESTRPFLSDAEYQKTSSIVSDFEHGIGKELQFKLLEHSKHKRNWMSKWWEKYAYVSARTPHAPFLNFAGPSPVDRLWFPQEGTQAERASLFTWWVLKFWELIRKEKLAVDRGGGRTIWCMAQYLRIFNDCKSPDSNVCQLNHYFKTDKEGGCPFHIVALHKGKVFSFDCLDSRGEILTAPEIQSQFQYIIDINKDKPNGIGLGALTAHQRDTWKKLRDRLITIHPDNLMNLEVIQKSVFVMVLDERSTFNRDEILREGLFGDPLNRWYDKTLSFITTKNGNISYNCDHSPLDGIVMVMMTNFVYQGLVLNKGVWQGTSHVRLLPNPQELVFHVDNDILKGIDEGCSLMNTVERNTEVITPTFTKFGSEFIKSFGVHPDPVVQLALQLAYYKLHNKIAPTYETATTRKFYGARTETVRSGTMEALAWCKAMIDPQEKTNVRMKLLMNAYKKQKQLMADAMNGMGIDRHLLGLQIIAMEEGMDMPLLFTDPGYTKSGGGGNYILSTSFVGWTPITGCVLPMCKEGYGVFYNIEPDKIGLLVTRWRDDDTNVLKLYKFLEENFQSIEKLMTNMKK